MNNFLEILSSQNESQNGSLVSGSYQTIYGIVQYNESIKV
jgi:hypothetical protein